MAKTNKQALARALQERTGQKYQRCLREVEKNADWLMQLDRAHRAEALFDASERSGFAGELPRDVVPASRLTPQEAVVQADGHSPRFSHRS